MTFICTSDMSPRTAESKRCTETCAGKSKASTPADAKRALIVSGERTWAIGSPMMA